MLKSISQNSACIKAIRAYVKTGALPPVFAQTGTPFQQRVWKALLNIPAGETRTYQQIANAIKQPKAVRAVANAIGANRNVIHVPCHRVVRSDGSLGGFAFGPKLKRELLAAEQSRKAPVTSKKR